MKLYAKFTSVLIVILSCSALMVAQVIKERVRVPDGSKFYVAPMEGDLQGFIVAELMKRKLPITVVTDEKDADYIITGGSVKGEHRWYDTVITGIERDKNQGNIQVVSVRDKTVIWAGEAGDRSLWWGSLKRGGRRKVAERLIGKMKSELFKK